MIAWAREMAQSSREHIALPEDPISVPIAPIRRPTNARDTSFTRSYSFYSSGVTSLRCTTSYASTCTHVKMLNDVDYNSLNLILEHIHDWKTVFGKKTHTHTHKKNPKKQNKTKKNKQCSRVQNSHEKQFHLIDILLLSLSSQWATALLSKGNIYTPGPSPKAPGSLQKGFKEPEAVVNNYKEIVSY